MAPNTPSKAVSEFRVHGLVAAPCTPFKENGDLNLSMIEPYVDHMVSFNMRNVFITGSVGEGLHMTVLERKQVADAWVKYAHDKLDKVIIHIGAGNVKDSQELARHAADIGAAAFACVGPTYFKPRSLEAYVEYMRQVASVAPELPFLLYDIDFITGITYNTNDFFHMAKDKIPNLVGVKHTSPHFAVMDHIIHDHDNRFQVLLGSDELFLEGLVIGVETTVMSSFMGHVVTRVKAAFQRGDIATARSEQRRILDFCKVKAKYGLFGPDTIKLPLKLLGLDMGQPRCPLQPFIQKTQEAFKKDLEDIGFFEWILKA